MPERNASWLYKICRLKIGINCMDQLSEKVKEYNERLKIWNQIETVSAWRATSFYYEGDNFYTLITFAFL